MKYTPDSVKLIEELGSDQYDLVRKVLGHGEITTDLARSGLRVQEQRLRLAQEHLDVAVKLNSQGVKGEIRPEKRSVISRAYYAMFCAARAALSCHENGDKNEHSKLPVWLGKVPLGPEQDRDRVVQALNTFRAARNEADYSPFYPRPLGRDAQQAVREAKAVLRICKRWVKETVKQRGIKQ